MRTVDRSNVALSAEDLDVLAGVLDTLIPPSDDGRFPGAGALGCARQVAENCGRVPGLLELLRSGLRELNHSSVARRGEPFHCLPPDAREQLLAEQSFVFPLVIQAYIAYYQHPAVLEALGLEPRPPHPLGYRMSDPGKEPAPNA
ncbi:hypothetical protein HRbin30_01991 [bacterium HR30]|nr:hypothetical protein HRbin30_01991 [bacterium HR30]